MMPRKLLPVLLLLTAVLLSVGVVGAQDEVTATLSVAEGPSATEGPYTVGDPIELTLSVTHPAGYQVIAPELGEQWGDFVIRSLSPVTQVENEDGTPAGSRRTSTITIDARLFAPGDFTTPPLPVTVTDGAGRLLEVTAAPAAVTVTSVLIEGDKALRDIKPQADLPFANLLPWLAGGLLLALAAGAGYWAWKRRQAQLALAAVDKRLPHEIALDELDHIAHLGLPEQGRFKEHYTLVSDTVRLYLEKIYGVPVMERTTGEVAAELRETTMERTTRRRAVTFLEESDLVKFADLVPGEASAYELIAQGRMIVEATRPAGLGYQPSASENGQGRKLEVEA